MLLLLLITENVNMFCHFARAGSANLCSMILLELKGAALIVARVGTVLALMRGLVQRSFAPKRLRTGPRPVLRFTIEDM